MGIREIQVEEGKTVGELIAELPFSCLPVLLELNGKIFYPDEIKDRRLETGDKVALIPLIAG